MLSHHLYYCMIIRRVITQRAREAHCAPSLLLHGLFAKRVELIQKLELEAGVAIDEICQPATSSSGEPQDPRSLAAQAAR